jgi:hypothetical protein
MKTIFYSVLGFGIGVFLSYLLTSDGMLGWFSLASAIALMVLGFKVFKSK